MRSAWAALLALCLTACLPATDNTAPQSFLGDAEGLQPLGTPLRIDFGRAQAGVIDTVSRLLGAAPSEMRTQEECGAGPIASAIWASGLTLNFQDGDFRGWVLSAGDAAGGLSVGQSLADLPPAPQAATSLGTELDWGGIYGLVPDGRDHVTLLWAGTTCFFR